MKAMTIQDYDKQAKEKKALTMCDECEKHPVQFTYAFMVVPRLLCGLCFFVLKLAGVGNDKV